MYALQSLCSEIGGNRGGNRDSHLLIAYVFQHALNCNSSDHANGDIADDWCPFDFDKNNSAALIYFAAAHNTIATDP